MEIKTFLRKPTKSKFSLDALSEHPTEFYADLEGYSALKNKYEVDYYSRGVIFITFNGDFISNFKEHDLVIPFWINLLAGVVDYLHNGKAEAFFQDRSGHISLQKSYLGIIELKKIYGSDKLMGTWYVPEKEFLSEIYKEGIKFNEFLLVNKLKYNDIENLLMEIQNSITI